MKKKFLLFLFLNCVSFIFNCAFSQNPLVKMWDYSFGGDSTDGLNAWFPQPSRDYLIQTSDHGYLIGGFSLSSISGDKTQGSWFNIYDYWIVKTDSSGIKLWDKDIGGYDRDELDAIIQTSDGGFIIAGRSLSGIGGDKTQNCWGDYDYWIIKLDSFGNILWDKDYGGTLMDAFFSLQQTSDHGYILGGYSSSGISGDKTYPSWGGYDYWIVKIDSSGNIQWDKDYGGTASDQLHTVLQTSDGGYLLAGNSLSGINGDKSQLNWGGTDYWIVKTDSFGNKQWDKRYGGTGEDFCWSAILTSDGGYILGGTSSSGAGGDKTTPTYGSVDYWIVKIDSLGNVQWDRDFGGSLNEDEFGNISQTKDGGYLLCGTSYSPISGTKSENNLALEQSWIVKTDLNGFLDWDKTLLNGYNESCNALQSNDGCYVFANYNDGGIGGDKSQPCKGNTDYWIIKFCDGNTLPPIIAFNSSSELCPGTCSNFNNLTINAVSYQWSFPGASPDTSTDTNPQNICYANPGSYDVQLIATNANGSDTLLLTNYITVYPSPPPQSISQSGDTLFAIAGSANYQWYFNGNIINGATDYFYVASSSGDYNVIATDGNGCEVEAAIFNVVAGLTPALSQGEGVMVFPNPVEDKVKIQKLEVKSDAAVEISVYNMVGEKVMTDLQEQGAKNQDVEIDVSWLVSGMYWIEISLGEKRFRTKFVKSTLR